jgi:molecular chaperone HtpG
MFLVQDYKQMMVLKKISNYITRKVADKLKSLLWNREDFEAKWNDIKIVLEYGMSEDKFYEKAGAVL